MRLHCFDLLLLLLIFINLPYVLMTLSSFVLFFMNLNSLIAPSINFIFLPNTLAYSIAYCWLIGEYKFG